MFILQISRQRTTGYTNIPTINNSALHDPSVLDVFTYDKNTAYKVETGPTKNLSKETYNFLSKLFYTENDLGKYNNFLSSPQSNILTHDEISTGSGVYSRVLFPGITTEQIYLSQRLFINRAYVRKSRTKLDPSLELAAEFVFKDILAHIQQRDYSSNKFNIAIRIPVERLSSYNENKKIASALSKRLYDKLDGYGLDATINISLVKMTFLTLSNLLDVNTFENNPYLLLKRALYTDAQDENGIKLFENSKPNTLFLDTNPDFYEKLLDIYKAKNISSLKTALSTVGNVGIFFPNHKKNKFITSCYDKLRYVGISPKSSIYLDAKSGYLYMFSQTNVEKRNIAQTYKKMKNTLITLTYLDRGRVKTISCSLKYDKKSAFTGAEYQSLVLADSNLNYIDVYSLLNKKGASLNIYIDEQPLLKLVRLDEKPVEKIEQTPVPVVVKTPKPIEKIKKPKSEAEFVNNILTKNMYVVMGVDYSGSMGYLVRPIADSFSVISKKISKSENIETGIYELAGGQDADNYQLTIEKFLDWVEKGDIPDKKYHLILVGDGGDIKWDYKKYLKRAKKDNVFIHYIYASNYEFYDKGPSSQMVSLSFYSGGSTINLGGKEANYFVYNQDKLRLMVLEMINNAHIPNKSEEAQFYISLGKYDEAVKVDPTVKKEVAKKLLERGKRRANSYEPKYADVIKDFESAVKYDPELSDKVSNAYFTLARKELDNYTYDKGGVSTILFEKAAAHGNKHKKRKIAEYQFRFGEYDNAVKNNPRLSGKVAKVYFRLGKEEFDHNRSKADEYFAKAIKYNPIMKKKIANYYRSMRVTIPEAYKYPEKKKKANDDSPYTRQEFSSSNRPLSDYSADDLINGKPRISETERKSAPKNRLGRVLNYYNIGFIYDELSTIPGIKKSMSSIAGQVLFANLGTLALVGKSKKEITDAAKISFSRLNYISKRFRKEYLSILNHSDLSSDSRFSDKQFAAAKAYKNILSDPALEITYGHSTNLAVQLSNNKLVLDCDLSSVLFLHLCAENKINAKFVGCGPSKDNQNHAVVAFLDENKDITSYFDSTGIMYAPKNNITLDEVIIPPPIFHKQYAYSNPSQYFVHSAIYSLVAFDTRSLKKIFDDPVHLVNDYKKVDDYYSNFWANNKGDVSAFYTLCMLKAKAAAFADGYKNIVEDPSTRQKLTQLHDNLIYDLKKIREDANQNIDKTYVKDVFVFVSQILNKTI